MSEKMIALSVEEYLKIVKRCERLYKQNKKLKKIIERSQKKETYEKIR